MKRLCAASVFALLSLCTTASWAGFGNHYTNGVEGIRAASLPPPGLYFRLYNVYYSAGDLKDTNGDSLGDFDLDVFAVVPRLIWVSEYKLLGADYFADVIIPLVNTDVSLGMGNATLFDDDKFGLGDIAVEPFGLSWHGDRYDASFAAGVYLPVGEYDETEPASPGLNYWTGMITAGGTYYLDQAKTWSASILARYEFHGENDDTDMTNGDDFHFEWGIGKKLAQFWEIGAAGYCQWQVSDDSGKGATDSRDRVYAAGPEINYFIASLKTNATLRYVTEFGAEDRSEGDLAALIFTHIF